MNYEILDKLIEERDRITKVLIKLDTTNDFTGVKWQKEFDYGRGIEFAIALLEEGV